MPTTSGSLWLPLGPIDPSISDPDPIYPENSDLETENSPGSTIFSDFPEPIRFSEDILIFDDKNGNENFVNSTSKNTTRHCDIKELSLTLSLAER